MAIAARPHTPITRPSREPAPALWVVARRFGAVSEVWMRRQVNAMSALDPRVVCWERHPGESEPVRCPVHVLGGSGRDDPGAARWLDRLGGLPTRNFAGAPRAEREALLNLARRERPDAMLVHFGHVALRVLPVAQTLGVPLVVHFHGLDLSQSLRNRWYRWSLWANLRRFDAAVCVGSHQRRLLLEHGMPADRVHLIPCGVPTSEFLPTPREPGDGPVRFITVGRLVEWKGPHRTIEAFANAVERGMDATLDLVGDGPMLEELREITRRLRVAQRVVFHRDQPPRAVREMLRASDVFLLHSLNAQGASEGFGVAIAEAAASALPVIATRCGGIEDQVIHGRTGLLVDQHDTRAMSDAMLALARDPDLRRALGDAGRARTVEHFDATNQVRALEGVLLNAVAARRGVA
ncbi:MAG TPA: hypothetical protein DEB06_11800 [Phycisphaerales bacterium]|nr:hypothetical protein [Phycisphaerales bacterium]